MKRLVCLLLMLSTVLVAQDYGDLPKIPKDKLLRDLELLRQGLVQHHTGLYWYTSPDTVAQAFDRAKQQIDRDLTELAFFNIIAPLVGLSREDHTDVYWSKATRVFLREKAAYLPLKVIFLDRRLYVMAENSRDSLGLVGSEILSINGQTPEALVAELGELFASDGLIRAVKYSDLSGRYLALYHFVRYGYVKHYTIEVRGRAGERRTLQLQPKTLKEIRWKTEGQPKKFAEEYEYRQLDDSTAYLAVHTFGLSNKKHYAQFLQQSFQSIAENQITRLVVDVSQNGGGAEGNENLLYSYLGENYQKYRSVCAKSRRSVLDNGVDRPIRLTTFSLWDVWFGYQRQPDGSYCRKSGTKHGLRAYRTKPQNAYSGKLFVLISPITYSGGSEFANMLRTRGRATFVGEETGGGYHGNTSGYSSTLTLPHSKITVDIPTLKFEMNVEGGQWGRGVLPDYRVIPTIEEYLTGVYAPLQFILDGKASSR